MTATNPNPREAMSNVTIPVELFKSLLTNSRVHILALLEQDFVVDQDWAEGRTIYRREDFTVIEKGNLIEVEAHKTIYVWCEHTASGGHVCIYDENDEEQKDWIENTDDVFQWGYGTREDLVEQAIDRLSVNYGMSAIDNIFAWKCARSVLRHLGEPDYEYDPEKNVYVKETDGE